jgi:triphosphoribosyl-dephospho-CoA synthase
MLARYPDSHIERKYGKQYSEWIAVEMSLLCRDLKTANQPEEVLPILARIDKTFKAKKINPGTTADITVATVLVVLLEQLIGNFDCRPVLEGSKQKLQ